MRYWNLRVTLTRKYATTKQHCPLCESAKRCIVNPKQWQSAAMSWALIVLEKPGKLLSSPGGTGGMRWEHFLQWATTTTTATTINSGQRANEPLKVITSSFWVEYVTYIPEWLFPFFGWIWSLYHISFITLQKFAETVRDGHKHTSGFRVSEKGCDCYCDCDGGME